MNAREPLHNLLQRQLRRHLGPLSDLPAPWQAFLNDVNQAYVAGDADRAMMERSLELSSQELVDANAQMRAVFQAIPDMVLRVDAQGVVIDVKAGASHALQVNRADFEGRPLNHTPLRDAANQLTSAVHQVLAFNAAVSTEYTQERADGQAHCEARLLPLNEAQVVIIVRDITERKHAELRVHEDLQTLQRAAEAAQAITLHQTQEALLQELAAQARAVLRAHQCLVSLQRAQGAPRLPGGFSVSDKYADWQGLAASRAVVHSAADMGLTEAEVPLRLSHAQVLDNPRWRVPLTESPDRPVARGWLVTALKNRQGETVGYLELSDKFEGEFSMQDQYVLEELTHIAATAIENVSLIEEVRQLNADLERRVAERTEALAHQEALFQAAADQAPQVMWIVNPKGAVTYLNRAWYALVGGAPPQWQGHEWGEVVMPEDVAEMRTKWITVNREGGIFSGVRRVRAQDGSVHTLSYRASPVRGPRGEVTCWVGMDADITEIKAVEAALRRANGELEAFSYSVSHDLRAPLRTIDGFTQLLAAQLPTDSNERVRAHLSRIRGAVAQMGELIESLLELARISHTALRHTPVDLSHLAHRIIEQLRARAPERRVTVDIQADLVVSGDAGFLAIALENLLANAWKFTARSAHATIRVGREAPDGAASGAAVYFVADNGAGFDMAYADKLFGTFQRLHAASEFPGTGVGLATVKRVIDRHEGQVWARSRPGEGATFFFTLSQGGRAAPPPTNSPAELA